MSVASAAEEAGSGLTGGPTGFRRLTPSLLTADQLAARFDGLPAGVTAPGQLLAALKAAAPQLGLSPRLVHTVDWLFRFTQPQDWVRGGQPIVWPSAALQQAVLGLSASQVKAVNRALIEAGLVSMKDSPNGKRYGHRDRQGRITEAYGFDLSPIAGRHADFVRLAEAAKAERAEMGRLRRRATIARNGITQILETAAEYGFQGENWATLACDSRTLTQSLRRVERIEELALGVEGLERRQREGRKRLEILLSTVAVERSEGVISDPKGPENRPHHFTYNPSYDSDQNTVMAQEGGQPPVDPPVPIPETPALPTGSQAAKPAQPMRTEETVLRLSPDELVRLAPRLRAYLRTPSPTWPDVVDAADWLRGTLGVSKPLWGEACLTMGREEAAIAVAVVSAKPAGHFRSSPGGYFHGMVAKAKVGELNLARTIWGLRARTQPAGERQPAQRAL